LHGLPGGQLKRLLPKLAQDLVFPERNFPNIRVKLQGCIDLVCHKTFSSLRHTLRSGATSRTVLELRCGTATRCSRSRPSGRAAWDTALLHEHGCSSNPANR